MAASENSKMLYDEKSRIQSALTEISGSLMKKFFDNNLGKSGNGISEPSDALQHVLDVTRELLQAEKCALFLVDISGQSLLLERVSGNIDNEKLKDFGNYDVQDGNKLGGGVTPWVLMTRRPFNAKSFDELKYNSEGHWKGNWDVPMYNGHDQAQHKFKCVYMVPLMGGSNAIGVLKYENRTADYPKQYFDDADERLIDTISEMVTNMIISQRIERNRYDKILPEISSTLVSPFKEEKDFYEELLNKCRKILCADLCSLFLLDDDKNLNLVSIVGEGITEAKKDQLSNFGYKNYINAEGLTPQILIKGKSFNAKTYPDLITRSEGKHKGAWDKIIYNGDGLHNFRSLYSTPLIIGNEHIGVFKVENKNVAPFYFTENDERLFDLIGRMIAIGVKYWRAHTNEEYLSKIMRTQDMDFLYSCISHEFKNYLQEFISITDNALTLDTVHKMKVKLEVLMKKIEASKTMIDDFNLTVKGIDRNITIFNIDEAIKSISKMFRQKCNDQHIRLTYNENKTVKDVQMRPSDIWSIMTNLLKNAFDAIVEKKTGDRRIEIKLERSERKELKMIVSDSGTGIPLERQHLVFNAGYTTKHNGMGIGLFWVKRLVSNMNGTIVINSPNEYGGASFILSFPDKMKKGEVV